MTFSEECKKAILSGNIGLAEELANKAINEDLDINEVIDSFSLAIREAGDLFEEGEFFLPELMRSAEAMKAAMAIIQPLLQAPTPQTSMQNQVRKWWLLVTQPSSGLATII